MIKTLAAFVAVSLLALTGCTPAAVGRPPAGQRPAAEAPPCVPAPGLAAAASFSPALDAVRTAAAADLLARIASCQPLPFSHDGIIFGNREGRLPPMPRGHYKEYTLVIPGSREGDRPAAISVGTMTLTTGETFSARGPERLVIGGGRDIYYTPDHYLNFVQLQARP